MFQGASCGTCSGALSKEADFEDSPPALAVGASGFATFASNRDPFDTHVRIAGAEVAFRSHGFDLSFEAMTRGREGSWIRGAYLRGDYYLRALKTTVGVRVIRIVSEDPREPSAELALDGGFFPLGHDLKVIGDFGVSRATTGWAPTAAIQIQTGF